MVARATLVEVAARFASPPLSRVLISSPDGRQSVRTGSQPRYDNAYWQELRLADPNLLRIEADELYRRVLRDYAGLPGVNGTLGQIALSRLEALHIVVPGKPAPSIEGKDLDGEPMRLSDFRGRVVVLVFFREWGRNIPIGLPIVRDLAEKYKDKPVMILGVTANRDKAILRKIMAEHGDAWRNWFDPVAGNEGIRDRYHLKILPALAVIDATGTLCIKCVLSTGADALIDELLKAMETEAKAGPARP